MYTQRKRPPRKSEMNTGELKMETAGYIPAKDQIMNIINAGRRLENYRRENYDFEPGQKEYDFPIPDRAPNFDMADASRIAEEVQDSLDLQAESLKQTKDKEAKEKADQIAKDAIDAEQYRKSLTVDQT